MELVEDTLLDPYEYILVYIVFTYSAEYLADVVLIHLKLYVRDNI